MIHGIIDLLWVDNGTLVIGDYKTSRSYMTDADLSTKLQAQLYATAVHQIRPDLPLRVEFYMIRHPENGPVVWVPEEDSFERIEKQLYAYQTKINEDETFEAIPSEDCKWCEYNYCCKTFKNWIMSTPSKEESENGREERYRLWENMGVIELLGELDEWHGKFISAKNIVEDLKKFARESMERENQQKLGGWKITRTARSEYHPSVQALIAQYGGLNKIKYNHPELYDELEQFKKTKWGKPHLRNYGG